MRFTTKWTWNGWIVGWNCMNSHGQTNDQKQYDCQSPVVIKNRKAIIELYEKNSMHWNCTCQLKCELLTGLQLLHKPKLAKKRNKPKLAKKKTQTRIGKEKETNPKCQRKKGIFAHELTAPFKCYRFQLFFGEQDVVIRVPRAIYVHSNRLFEICWPNKKNQWRLDGSILQRRNKCGCTAQWIYEHYA